MSLNLSEGLHVLDRVSLQHGLPLTLLNLRVASATCWFEACVGFRNFARNLQDLWQLSTCSVPLPLRSICYTQDRAATTHAYRLPAKP